MGEEEIMVVWSCTGESGKCDTAISKVSVTEGEWLTCGISSNVESGEIEFCIGKFCKLEWVY